MKKVLCAVLVVLAVAGAISAEDFIAEREDANARRKVWAEASTEFSPAS